MTRVAGREDTAALLMRLKKIEGQVRAVGRMLESDRDCADVVTQLSAVLGALQAFGIEVWAKYFSECLGHLVEGTFDQSRKDELDRLHAAFPRFLHSSYAGKPYPGSTMQLYWDGKQWHVKTEKDPDT